MASMPHIHTMTPYKQFILTEMKSPFSICTKKPHSRSFFLVLPIMAFNIGEGTARCSLGGSLGGLFVSERPGVHSIERKLIKGAF